MMKIVKSGDLYFFSWILFKIDCVVVDKFRKWSAIEGWFGGVQHEQGLAQVGAGRIGSVRAARDHIVD